LKVFCQKREAFTRDTVSEIFKLFPRFNWVICHSPYSVAFNGVEGTDWGHIHYELNISFNITIGSVQYSNLNVSSIFSFSFFLITF
jgi:hypothetical protein